MWQHSDRRNSVYRHGRSRNSIRRHRRMPNALLPQVRRDPGRRLHHRKAPDNRLSFHELIQSARKSLWHRWLHARKVAIAPGPTHNCGSSGFRVGPPQKSVRLARRRLPVGARRQSCARVDMPELSTHPCGQISPCHTETYGGSRRRVPDTFNSRSSVSRSTHKARPESTSHPTQWQENRGVLQQAR